MKYYDNCRGLAYTIKSGDTLYGISKKYNVPLALILRANPYVDIYNLQIGSRLCIPLRNQNLNVTIIPFEINGNESILDILERFDIDLSDLLRYNNLAAMKLAEGVRLEIPTRQPVREDDTEFDD